MATNSIKGLTVEIGGDTTSLGKALESINSKSKMLSSELGAINKLLKVDPGNYEALAQKQKILADAVENTRKKLDTLKEAEAQVQAQFERGEVSEEQVSKLRTEIVNTTAKLKTYEKAAQETAEATKKIGDGAGEAADELDETGDEAKDSAKKVDEFADAADNAEKSGGGLGSTLANVAKTGLAAIGTAAAAAVTGLVAAAESSREYRTDMGKLNTAFETAGHSSEAAYNTYSKLYNILGDTGQSVEAANHLAQLVDTEKDLSEWTKICEGVYATFGDSLPIEGLTEAANETAKTGALTGGLTDAINWAAESGETFGVTLRANTEENKAWNEAVMAATSAEDYFNLALQQCSTEQERQALITETLNGLYSEAAEEYTNTNAALIRANAANEDWTKSMAELGGAVEPVISTTKILSASLLSELVPGVTEMAGAISDLMDGVPGAADQVGEALSGIITQVLNMATELAPTIVEVGVSLITTLVTTLVSMLPQLVTTGAEIIVTVLEGVTSAIPQLTQALVDMIPQLTQALITGIPLILEAGINLLMALVDAIPQILPPLIEALPQIITLIIQTLISASGALVQGALQLFIGIVEALPLIIPALLAEIPNLVTTLITTLAQNYSLIYSAGFDLFLALVKAIPEIVLQLATAVPDIIAGIVQGLLDGIGSVGEAALELGRSILDSIKSFFGINSPSTVMKEQGGYIVDGMVNGLKNMPAQVASTISGAVEKVVSWGSNLVSKAKTAASNMLSGVTSTLSGIPGKITSAISGAISNVATWGTNMVSKAKSGMASVVSTVQSTLSGLPSKVLSIGGNLVTGLWSGISDKFSWLTSKISGFASSVLGSIKSFFGINSPSKETAWMGDMLDQGLAEGLLANMKDPVKAMGKVTSGVLGAAEEMDGLAVERSLQVSAKTAAATAAADSGIISKLDRILTAIEKGQVLMLDGDALVGGTVDRYDTAMGQRRLLAARGAV